MRWEYLHIHVESDDIDTIAPGHNEAGWNAVLNARGAEGWELVQVWPTQNEHFSGTNLVFKRALPDG